MAVQRNELQRHPWAIWMPVASLGPLVSSPTGRRALCAATKYGSMQMRNMKYGVRPDDQRQICLWPRIFSKSWLLFTRGSHPFPKRIPRIFSLSKATQANLSSSRRRAACARRGRERPSNNISSTVAIDPLHSASDILTFHYKMVCSTFHYKMVCSSFFCLVFLVIVIVLSNAWG